MLGLSALPTLVARFTSEDSSRYDRGDIAFIMVAGALVFFMIPGLSFLYAGMVRRKSSLSLIWVVSACNAVVVFQWVFWGYSLAFSKSATTGIIGNLRNFGLMNVSGDPSPGSPLIPEILYSFLQMEFACVTMAILIGAVAERGRVLPSMVFTFIWMTLVYCPIAYWAWGANGWGNKWGVLDFAGGGPVEIASGVSGLAYAWVLGRRQETESAVFRPYSVAWVNLGTFILWFGWLGFNGGSAYGANLRAIYAMWNTMIAGAIGGVAWCVLDFRLQRKWSMVSLCCGTIAGLVGATSTAGYIHPWASILVGVLSGVLCNLATKIKYLLQIDDALDIFAAHGVGGIIGLLFNAFFASKTITALDGTSSISGGWIDGNWKQLYIQFAYVCATATYSFIITVNIANLMAMIPGLRLRATPEQEQHGMDEAEIGEYATDYIELERDFVAAIDLPRSKCIPGYTAEARNSRPASGVGSQRNKADKAGEAKVEWNDDKVDEAKVQWNELEEEITETTGTRRDSIIVIQSLNRFRAT